MDSKEHRVVVVLGYKYEEIDDLFCIFEKDLEINLFETPTKDGKDKLHEGMFPLSKLLAKNKEPKFWNPDILSGRGPFNLL